MWSRKKHKVADQYNTNKFEMKSFGTFEEGIAEP